MKFDQDLVTTDIVALMRARWDLAGVADDQVRPLALRLLHTVRGGLGQDALADDLNEALIVRLARPVGNRELDRQIGSRDRGTRQERLIDADLTDKYTRLLFAAIFGA